MAIQPSDPAYSEGPQRYSQHWGLTFLEPKPPAPLWTAEETTTVQPMTAEQAATLKPLANAAYEREAFQPNLTRAEADLRIAMLTGKLKLLDGPPHTLLRSMCPAATSHRFGPSRRVRLQSRVGGEAP
jgi:hypothetical protein